MLDETEFQSIAAMVEQIVKDMVGTKRSYFITGTVIRVDELNKCVYLAEFDDQAIPIVGFKQRVTFYDETPQGTNYGTAGSSASFNTTKKTVIAEIVMPKVGENVLVVREMGANHLPRCLGVILGKNWVTAEEDD